MEQIEKIVTEIRNGLETATLQQQLRMQILVELMTEIRDILKDQNKEN